MSRLFTSELSFHKESGLERADFEQSQSIERLPMLHTSLSGLELLKRQSTRVNGTVRCCPGASCSLYD